MQFKKLAMLLCCTLFFFQNMSQLHAQNVTLSGYIKDKNSGEDLIGANIYDESGTNGATTNAYGFYSLTLPQGDYKFTVSYIGYDDKVMEMSLQESQQVNVFVEESSEFLSEIVVTSKKDKEPINQKGFVRENITILKARTLPKMFGEPDIVKVLQMQTGIKNLGDGSSGMYVRGGNIDQNLMLYDEAVLYNISHMYGLVSTFNPEIVKNASVYKGAIPSKYGGRLSSVVDVHMREGNSQSWTASGSVSLLTASLAGSVPIQKGKSSILVAVRKSIFDLLQESAGSTSVGGSSIPSFYDINSKVNYSLGDKDRLFLSVYFGNDKITFPDSNLDNNWTNSAVTLRWNHLFSDKLFSSSSLIYSDYENKLNIEEKVSQKQTISSGIKGFTFKSDFSYFVSGKSSIDFGGFLMYKEFQPTFNSLASENISNFDNLKYGIYAEHSYDFTPKLNVHYGIRALIYQNIGKAFWYKYDDNLIPIKKEMSSSGTYTTYPRVEPRFTLNYNISKQAVFKLGYSMIHQFEQLIQNTANTYSSYEIWMPSNVNVKPQKGQTLSTGLFFNKKDWGATVEGYYKKFNNQLDYIDHAKLLNQPYLETQLRVGDAEAYGAEFSIKKNTGKITGSLSYTYSRVLRTIKGINNGNAYSAPYDIPHDIRLISNFKFTKPFSLAMMWVYNTGRASNLPVGLYRQGKNLGYIYGERNSQRFSDYHRLDVSLNWTKKKKTKGGKKVERNFSIGIYNLYYKHNPIIVQYPPVVHKLSTPQVVEYSFPRIFPSISYSLSFK